MGVLKRMADEADAATESLRHAAAAQNALADGTDRVVDLHVKGLALLKDFSSVERSAVSSRDRLRAGANADAQARDVAALEDPDVGTGGGGGGGTLVNLLKEQNEILKKATDPVFDAPRIGTGSSGGGGGTLVNLLPGGGAVGAQRPTVGDQAVVRAINTGFQQLSGQLSTGGDGGALARARGGF